MQHLVIVFVAALLGNGCRSASARHLKLLPEIDNNVDPSAASQKPSGSRKFVSMTRRPSDLTPHTPGAVLTLTCEALGSPAPNIRWFKNDAPVYEYDMESNELTDSNPQSLARATSSLLVTHTETKDEYTCLAAAGQKTVRATTIVYRTDGGNVEFTERQRLVPLAPRVLGSYKVLVDTIGSSVILPCVARGHPRPNVTWRDSRGVEVKRDHRMKVLRSGELVISRLRWADMGELTCTASNVFGSSDAKTFLYPAKAG